MTAAGAVIIMQQQLRKNENDGADTVVWVHIRNSVPYHDYDLLMHNICEEYTTCKHTLCGTKTAFEEGRYNYKCRYLQKERRRRKEEIK